MEAPPAKLDGFFVDVAKIAADLRTTPVTADELERAKKPAIDGAGEGAWRPTSTGWTASPAPRPIRAGSTSLRSAEAELERVSAADVEKAAQT